jgi:hypothetical protein
MNNKKSLLQDSLQELENIKNESLELAKEQLINESADLLEKKSAALFEKLIAGEDAEEEMDSEEESNDDVNEVLQELKNMSDDEKMDSDDEDEMSDDEESEEGEEEEMDSEEEISLDDLRKAAEEHGFKLVQADSDEEEMDSDEEEMEMDSDEEEMEMDSDEEEMDSEEEEDDDIEFNDVEVDDKVLTGPSKNKLNEIGSNTMYGKEVLGFIKDMLPIKIFSSFFSTEVIETINTRNDMIKFISDFKNEYGKEPSFILYPSGGSSKLILTNNSEDESEQINENFKRNNTKMRNTKKQVLKDLRDVSFNRLVEAYYNMDEEDSFVVKEGEPDEEYDDGYDSEETMHSDYEDEKSFRRDRREFEKPYIQGYDDDAFSDAEMDELEDLDEDTMYEIDMPEGGYGMESMSDEGYMYEMSDESYMDEMSDENYMDEMSDDDINEMLSEMDIEEDMFDESIATRTRDKFVKQGLTGPIHGKAGIDEKSELEEMFEEMSMEELEEMNSMLEGGDMGEMMHSKKMNGMSSKTLDSSMGEESDLTEAEIEEMLSSMKEEEEIEEGMSLRRSQANKHQAPSPRNREERIRPLDEEEDMEDVESLKEQLKKLKKENKSLNEGFTNKVKSLENKVYDVTISALKAGFVNKFLLEHPLRENEKLEIIHRFTNAQTKEQIKETYISLTNEFAKGQTVKDGSMLNESVQNKIGKIHRTDNVVVTEKNLINENSETNRFKQLLNYNFGRK